MKIYFDTNIIIDILEQRQPYLRYSGDVFLMVINGQIDGIIGASSITDVYYIVRKSRKDSKLALSAVLDLLETLTLVDTTIQDIYTATASPVTDFEDAVIAATSQRETADYIITRNAGDFVNSPIPALSPEDFLIQYAKEDAGN
ncbi:DNA-binding protein [Spirochaetia bacterium]|nr:DNA-binding protein [Spirochaetia bacterium]